MKETNSLQNLLMANTVGCPRPEIGMGVTIIGWTDRHPGTVTWVSPSGKTLRFREDDYRRTDDRGMTDSGQQYEFTPNPAAPEREARLTSKGRWRAKGQSIVVGRREKYHDFSF